MKAFCESSNPIIDLGEHCTKQTERVRASILTANGIQKLSVPIIRPFGNKTSTKDVQISFVEAWERDHCRTIEAAYSASPYFEDYSDKVFDLVNSKEESLFEFNRLILNEISKWLELPIIQHFETKYIDEPSFDFRDFNFDKKEILYQQVEFGQNKFTSNLSILDALFCLGPMARKLIIT